MCTIALDSKGGGDVAFGGDDAVTDTGSVCPFNGVGTLTGVGTVSGVGSVSNVSTVVDVDDKDFGGCGALYFFRRCFGCIDVSVGVRAGVNAGFSDDVSAEDIVVFKGVGDDSGGSLLTDCSDDFLFLLRLRRLLENIFIQLPISSILWCNTKIINNSDF